MTTISHATTGSGDTDAANAGQVPAPILSDDPFGLAVLDDPLPFHERLREAGRVVYVPQYDLFVMGRYDDVYAGLTDWQTFQSAAGVGLSNFRKEKPWRPPSLLLEADPPRHDAPRHALEEILNPRKLRHLREQWYADAETLVDEILEMDEVDGAHDIADVFPLRVFPDAVGLRKDGRENLLPYGDHTFNSFGPSNHLVERGQEHIGATSAWIAAQCAREALAEVGFGADIWAAADRGDVTPEMAPLMVRSLLTAGVDTTVHGHQRRPPCVRRAARPVGPAACPARACSRGLRRGDQARVTRADLLPDGNPRRRYRRCRHPRRSQGPPGPCRRQPRPAPLG